MVDICVPSLKLAIDYNGKYHYQKYDDRFRDVEVMEKKDEAKKEIVEAEGYTFVHIPYWWDNKMETLLSILPRHTNKIGS